MAPAHSTFIEAPEATQSDGSGMHVLVMSPDSFNTFPLPAAGVVTIGRSGNSQILIDDPMVSREHALLHVGDLGPSLLLEDTGSANGTRLRDQTMSPGQRIPIAPGEAISIGNTVLMVQQNRSLSGHHRLWSHAYFETRLEAECGRGDTSSGRFALLRLRLERPLGWTSLAPILNREVPAPNVFAAYGPNDYEILLIEKSEDEGAVAAERLRAALADADVVALAALACYPRDGRSVHELLSRANARLRSPGPRDAVKPSPGTRPASLQGAEMRRVHELAVRAAGSIINVLILGETGAGKEVMAKTVHRSSPRHEKPFLALNCAGLPETLIESELFGHERGAFTGAVAAKPGLLESADGGTVFLDEVGELPLNVQAKLLRIIETREVTRVGALRGKVIDVRFVSATNRDLEQEVMKGTFRRDLFFRLNGISLSIPPLRERPTEIPALAWQFMEACCKESGRPVLNLGTDAMNLLIGYSWPGNIRELRNVMDRAVLLCDGDEILPEHLPLEKMVPAIPGAVPRPTDGERASVALSFSLSPDELEERQRMVEALARSVGNQTKAALDIGMPRRTFVSKLDRYGIPRPQKRSSDPAEAEPDERDGLG
jgi:two-component system response regulator AtoC